MQQTDDPSPDQMNADRDLLLNPIKSRNDAANKRSNLHEFLGLINSNEDCDLSMIYITYTFN